LKGKIARETSDLYTRLLALTTAAGGLIYGYYFIGHDLLVPDLTPILPKPFHVLIAFILGIVGILVYHSRHELFRRVFRAGRALLFAAIFTLLIQKALILLIDRENIQTFSAVVDLVTGHYKASTVAQLSSLAVGVLCLIVGIASAWSHLTARGLPFFPSGETHLRGRGLISYEQAAKISEAKHKADPGPFFGMLRLPGKAETTHFLVAGATGSGKTITLRLMMQTVLGAIEEGKGKRALIYDAKQDMLSVLHGMDLKCPIVTLNPFDKRSAAWDMAKDITSPATAQQVATILIPEEKYSGSPYFSDAARALLTGVMVSFIQTAPGVWTFRDVLYAMRTADRLEMILKRTPETVDLIEQYFSNEKTANDVVSTIATKLQRYQYIAAAWDRADKKISLKEWLKDEYILVLGNDEAMRSALDAINQVIFKRLSELVLSQPESETRRTWFFLDELRQAGRLDGLNSLLTMGRSKGACVVIGFQDIEGLSSVYGDREASEIVGLCANKAILRLDSPNTAKWASSLFGEREVLEIRQSQNSGSGENSGRGGKSQSRNDSFSVSEQVAKRDTVLASEFMDLPQTGAAGGLTGFYILPELGAFSIRSDWGWIRQTLAPSNGSVANFDRRPEEEEYLESWDSIDFERLKLTAPLDLRVLVERRGIISPDTLTPNIANDGRSILSSIKRR
jgi:type IV secretory pathway TraG/TraD family ATPase VirD4